MNGTMMLHGFLPYAGVIISGLVATTVMTLFALSFTDVGLLSVNAVEAVGSSVSGRMRGARNVGFALHFITGLAFALVYAFLLQTLNISQALWPIAGGMIIGAVHGYIVSFFVVIGIGEYSHYAHFREAGIGVALVYLVSHVLYGATLGSMFYALHVFG